MYVIETRLVRLFDTSIVGSVGAKWKLPTMKQLFFCREQWKFADFCGFFFSEDIPEINNKFYSIRILHLKLSYQIFTYFEPPKIFSPVLTVFWKPKVQNIFKSNHCTTFMLTSKWERGTLIHMFGVTQNGIIEMFLVAHGAWYVYFW